MILQKAVIDAINEMDEDYETIEVQDQQEKVTKVILWGETDQRGDGIIKGIYLIYNGAVFKKA